VSHPVLIVIYQWCVSGTLPRSPLRVKVFIPLAGKAKTPPDGLMGFVVLKEKGSETFSHIYYALYDPLYHRHSYSVANPAPKAPTPANKLTPVSISTILVYRSGGEHYRNFLSSDVPRI